MRSWFFMILGVSQYKIRNDIEVPFSVKKNERLRDFISIFYALALIHI